MHAQKFATEFEVGAIGVTEFEFARLLMQFDFGRNLGVFGQAGHWCLSVVQVASLLCTTANINRRDNESAAGFGLKSGLLILWMPYFHHDWIFNCRPRRIRRGADS
jgi:hypothetical protein